METLQIQLNDSLSINELTALQVQGFSVMRSAHIGNLSPYNLALADAGIPMLLVDQNVTGFDKNYFPEFVMTQNEQIRVAEDGTVANRTRVSNDQFLDELHITGMREALPNADFFTNTEYLRRNEAVVGEMLRLGVKHFPEEFMRIVNANGTTAIMPGAADMVKSIGAMQLSDDPRAEKSAVLIPVNIDIMINFIIEFFQSEQDVQYHISGPDMIVYTQQEKRREMFQQFYEIIRREASFGDRLPRRLNVQLIPAASARFASSVRFQSEVEGLFSQLDASAVAVAALVSERKAFFTSEDRNDRDKKSMFEATSNEQLFAQDRAIVEKAGQVPGLFLAPKGETGFVTQYDVMQDGGLFVAPQNTTLSFGELKALVKRLADIRKRASP